MSCPFEEVEEVMKIAAQSGAMTKLGLLAMTACISPVFLQATPPACPSTVAAGAAFPDSTYVCSETDNYWLEFTDLGAITPGDTALPAGTIFHIDTVTPGTIAVTIEPGGTAQFASDDTYSWEYDVVEDSASNAPSNTLVPITVRRFPTQPS